MSPVDFAVNFLQKYVPSLYRSAGLEYGSTMNCTYQEYLFQVRTYRLTMSGGGGAYCSLNVRGRGAIEIYPAYVKSSSDSYGGATTDSAHYAPVLDENNTIVVHADGLVNGTLTYVQVVAPSGLGLQHTSVLLPRDSQKCSYEYYAPVPFFCSYEIRDFAVKTQLPFKFSADYAQVAAMTLADSAQGGFSFNAAEHTFDNVQMLLSNLTFLDRPGQNVTSAMQLTINSYGSANQGYRPSARHLLVYVTNNNPTDADPGALLYSIRRQGLYQIAIVTVDLVSFIIA
ncbi:hypothetical protein COOONC_21087 [Cooperia oncophora]